MTLHLSALNLSCHFSDQEHSETRSCCNVMLSAAVFIGHQIFVSSANILNSFLIQFGSSLTNKRKSRGPMTLPWGTPLRTACSCENTPRTPTVIVLDIKKSSSHAPSFPLIPNFLSFSNVNPRIVAGSRINAGSQTEAGRHRVVLTVEMCRTTTSFRPSW